MAAAALSRLLKGAYGPITLIESEATVPPIRLFSHLLGIDDTRARPPMWRVVWPA